jgi:hypothetical protein
MSGEDIGFMVVAGGMSLGAIAILGGITSGVLRGFQRQRMVELLQRERVALIERGVDPEKIPALNQQAIVTAFGGGIADERVAAEKRKQTLFIFGLVFAFLGIGLGIFLNEVAGPHIWAVGLMPFSIGLALLVGSSVVKPPEALK